MEPSRVYLELMQAIRARFDVIAALRNTRRSDFATSETSAFHARKIVEGVAFSCLVAVDNSLRAVPRDAKGKWNAEEIFISLKKKGISALPNPSSIRVPTDEERARDGIAAVVEGLPDLCLSYDDLIALYRHLHSWLHEINPYTGKDHGSHHSEHSQGLWDRISRLEAFLERHMVSIRGVGFLCVLRDIRDGQTKVLSITKGAP